MKHIPSVVQDHNSEVERGIVLLVSSIPVDHPLQYSLDWFGVVHNIHTLPVRIVL